MKPLAESLHLNQSEMMNADCTVTDLLRDINHWSEAKCLKMITQLYLILLSLKASPLSTHCWWVPAGESTGHLSLPGKGGHGTHPGRQW